MDIVSGASAVEGISGSVAAVESTARDLILVVHADAGSDEVRNITQALKGADSSVICASASQALDSCESVSLSAAILSLDADGVDAIALSRTLKSRAGERAFLPVIAVGSAAQIEALVRDYDGGCDDFMTTPVSPSELSVRLAALAQRRKMQAQQVELNAELEREQERRRTLAALIIHDLRNPLSAMVGNIQLLEEVVPDVDNGGDEMVLQCLRDLGELGAQTLSMVAGLLDVEEMEEGLLKAHRDVVDVHEFVLRMPRLYNTALLARRLQLSVHCPTPLVATFDRQLIARIIENLLDNAVRYAPRKGNVVLRVLVDGNDVVIEVGNDGPAIPEREQASIFERYYRLEARRKGARANRGLGLYFCHLAAVAHGGDIEVTSRPELPACFVLRLPNCLATVADDSLQDD